MINAERIAQLQEMLKEERGDIFLHYALGIEYLNHAAEFENAEHQFKHVLTLDGNYFAAHYQLGKLYEAQQRNNEALEHYRAGQAKAKALGNRKAAGEFDEAIFLLED